MALPPGVQATKPNATQQVVNQAIALAQQGKKTEAYNLLGTISYPGNDAIALVEGNSPNPAAKVDTVVRETGAVVQPGQLPPGVAPAITEQVVTPIAQPKPVSSGSSVSSTPSPALQNQFSAIDDLTSDFPELPTLVAAADSPNNEYNIYVDNRSEARKKGRGRGGTILSGPQGDTSATPGNKKTLLGV